MTDTPKSHRLLLSFAALGLVAAGGIAGGVASHAMRPPIEMAPLHPIAIRSLPTASGIVTIRGRVAETFGNKFVIDDGTARTLIDTGRAGDGTNLVGDGMPVTVQGRLEHGFVHASFLVDSAGKVTALGPMGGPMDGPPHDRRGPPRGPGEGPPHGDDMAPPPPPSSPVAG